MAPRVKIIVDSAGDLPTDWLQRWDIAVIPCFINFDTESYPDDGIALTKAEFYRKLATASQLPRTAAPPSGVAKDIIQKQLDKTEQVVVFTVASQLSSVYNSVRLAAQEVDPKRVTVIDSGNVSMAIGWMARAAAEAAETGAGVDEVLAAAQDVRKRTKLYAVIDTLEYLRRSGRVSTLVASIGTMLQIKPIIEVNEGIVTTEQRVRTMGKARQALIELVRSHLPIQHLAVLHTNFPEGGEALKAQVADIATPDTLVMDITTTVGTHIGPGCLGFSYVKSK